VPVAQSRGHAGKALLISAVAVVVGVVLLAFVAMAANRGNVDIRLGDERFDAGRTERLAKAIDTGGGLPFLYPDLTDRERAIFVQHTGDDPDEGWIAFSAFDPDDPDCQVEIDRDEEILVNSCDETVTYPLDGEGLRQYPTSVEDGRVYVDLNAEARATSTTRD
jgi:hypothetical protein